MTSEPQTGRDTALPTEAVWLTRWQDALNGLASDAATCHSCRVRLFFLFLALITTGGFALAQGGLQRTNEDKILNWDLEKTFDTNQSAPFRRSHGTFAAKGAQAKGFYIPQKVGLKEHRTREFAGTKNAWAGDFRFSTKEANTKGKYEIPNAGKPAETKTMAVGDARESRKSMPTRELVDADRTYLGKERQKLNRTLNPNEAADWRSSAGVAYTDKTVEMHGGIKELKTIEDVKALLNTSK